MNQQAAQKLGPGIYRLFWKDGGSSIAAVGILHDGRRWFAPCNWTSVIVDGIACKDWRLVSRVEPIKVAQC